MKRISVLATFPVLVLLLGSALLPQTPAPQPLTLSLECPGKDCPLLCGFVRLRPGDKVGWHSTGKNEETLVILGGRGEALIKGRAGMPFAAPQLVYIPPATEHNVTNTGDGVLEYVYVVAPARTD